MVGVILNLAVWFGIHVALPEGQPVDWYAVAVGLVACAGMVKWRWDIVPVVLGAGALGVIYRLR